MPRFYHCPQSYGEPETVPFFQGKFDGKTVFQNDFKKLLGRPSTSFKKSETTHVSNAEFHSETTNQSDYKLPQIFTKEQIHLRKYSKKNKEKWTLVTEKWVLSHNTDETTQDFATFQSSNAH